MFGNDRRQMRRFFTDAWSKHNNGVPMEPMEQVIVEIIQHHPEYHSLLEQADLAVERDFLPEMGETNPFLHVSMHVSLQEQISTDRPQGITAAYKELVMNRADAHAAEHMMMDCIAQMIWQAQTNNSVPDEQAYLVCVKNLLRK
jgi:hypothetical protein